MRIPEPVLRGLLRRCAALTARRGPDFVIGDPAAPYLQRWWLLPRNRWCNVYLHHILRDDDARALHDHRYGWLSVMLAGSYVEHSIAAGGIHHRRVVAIGDVRGHGPRFAHRLALRRECGECWTLFVTGPRVRNWGFHCGERGWVPWQQFTDPDTGGATTGRGCE